MTEPNDFQIDPHALDQEWLRQADLYHGYAVRLADARKHYETTKAEQEREDANLMRDIRESPADYGLDKITEAAVAACIQSNKGHCEGVQKLINAKHRIDLLQADVNALDHKRRALENLVELHGQDYFSEPRVRTAAGAAGVESIKKESVNERMRRRRAQRAAADDE